MHVGMAAVFQNTGRALSDHQIYLNELALADMAEPLGFDSIWSVEHHFTDYTMCPDVVQFLSYMAGRTRNVKLGSMVMVLPWHDPMRAAEQISMLDHLSGGRMILGLGRGAGKVEFDGFRLDMATAASCSSNTARGCSKAWKAASWSMVASTTASRRPRSVRRRSRASAAEPMPRR